MKWQVITGMKNHKSSPERHVAIYGSHDKKNKRWELEIDENNPKDMEALKLAVQHPPSNVSQDLILIPRLFSEIGIMIFLRLN